MDKFRLAPPTQAAAEAIEQQFVTNPNNRSIGTVKAKQGDLEGALGEYTEAKRICSSTGTLCVLRCKLVCGAARSSGGSASEAGVDGGRPRTPPPGPAARAARRACPGGASSEYW